MRLAAALAAAALLGLPAAARPETVEVGSARFERLVDAGGAPLALRGAGVFRWKWLVKVYSSALYLAPASAGWAPSEDGPVRLEFHYFVDIRGRDFGRAADDLLAKAFSPEALAPLRERLDRLHAAYLDVRPGDRYALTWRPGLGTELSYNGRPLALVEGADFARAYFAIWLGERPLDEGLRDRLLGR